jgi:hypothetical protein
MEKKLSIVFNVAEIEVATKRKPASMKIVFDYPSYLECCTKESNKLVELLIAQMSGRLGDIKVRGLSLVWDEDDEQKEIK